ncbi:MAG: hypothetical protein WCT51_02060 [Candidatus Shapirobacteria bacterium]|jgi:hypothetical protein
MTNEIYRLYTVSEIESLLGKNYFYKQRIYRLASSKKIVEFSRKGIAVYMASHVIGTFIKELELRIQDKFPELDVAKLRIFYDITKEKRIVVDGLFGRGISVNTDEENEEDLIKKIKSIIEWLGDNYEIPIESIEAEEEQLIDSAKETKDELAKVLPEEVFWVRLDTGIIEGIEIKSNILISLPSIAQFVGIRTNKLIEWISRTTFSNFVLSAHYRQIQGAGKPVPWKKGIATGLTPFIPFELLPEIIVALKQSRNTPSYPEKAEMLYELAQKTLSAVGLAVSGNKDKAAEELAKIGQGLGLSAADQIIGLFKQYESRDFQVQTTKEFNSKIKSLNLDYVTTIGKLTFGITGRYPSQWKLLGTVRNLPKIVTNSSREVMRKLEPSDSVGMAFGEKSFTKDPDINEAVETGKQGKNFYERLKKVGLLD